MLTARIAKFGVDVAVAPTSSYISLLRRGKKFAIVQPTTAERLALGVKLKGVAPAGRRVAAGSRNTRVTHRLAIRDPEHVDTEVIAWLNQADDAA